MKYPIGLVVRANPNVDARCVECDYKCGGRIGQIRSYEEEKYDVNFGSSDCIFTEDEITPMSKSWKENS